MTNLSKDDMVEDHKDEELAQITQTIDAILGSKEPQVVANSVRELHASDLADVLENLPIKKGADLIKKMGDEFDYEALAELDEGVRDKLLKELPNEIVAEAVKVLESDDAVYLLEDLKEADQSDILEQLPEHLRAPLERSLDYPEDSAGRLMQSHFIAVAPFWTVGQTIDYMRETQDLPEQFSQIYIVNPDFHLVGIVPLNRLLRSVRTVPVSDLKLDSIQLISAMEDQESVARRFQRYNLMGAPVVDEDKRLLGIITVDDIVDVIEEEAEEDIHRLGGVGNEALSNTVFRTAKARFIWLFINLITAVLASIVIGRFDATIEQMVALAILMPIVASMGGNAATQTMTVAVRALATKELSTINAARIISRETLVGLFNGIIFALIIGFVTYLWFGIAQLGVVIAAAMVINLIVAGMSGILVPILLDKLKIDPAIASGVFVTTVTDVIGFSVFLGLAALWLL